MKKAIPLFMVWYCIALAVNCTDTTIGAYIVYIGLLVVNTLLTKVINPTKYNKGVAVEDQL